jgi:hypothetical protein
MARFLALENAPHDLDDEFERMEYDHDVLEITLSHLVGRPSDTIYPVTDYTKSMPYIKYRKFGRLNRITAARIGSEVKDSLGQRGYNIINALDRVLRGALTEGVAITEIVRRLDAEVERSVTNDQFMSERPLKPEEKAYARKVISKCLLASVPITKECFIIRREIDAFGAPGIYLYFDDYKSFQVWFAALPAKMHVYHEVRKPGFPIRAAFDIDGGADNMKKLFEAKPALAHLDLEHLRSHILDWIVSRIITIFDVDYGMKVTKDDLAICFANNEKKTSIHITVAKKLFFSCDDQASEFQARVMSICEKDPETILLDKGCCMHHWSTMRMPLNAKVKPLENPRDEPVADDRILIPVGCLPSQALLGRVYGKQIKDVAIIPREDASCSMTLPEGLYGEMMAIIWKVMDESCFIPRDLVGSTMMTFNRTSASHCPICLREHTSEGFYAYLIKADVLISCFAATHTDIAASERVARRIGTLPYDPIAIAVMIRLANQSTTSLCPIEGATIYDEKAVHEYDFGHSSTMLIRAPMGSEKTKALIRYIEREMPTRILILSPRISFTEEMVGKVVHTDPVTGAKTPYLRDYRSIPPGLIDMEAYPRVIVQLESLWRIKCVVGKTMPDLLVLDESESIISQLQSKCLKQSGKLREVWSKFEYLISQSTKVIAMDAYLGERTRDVLATRTGPMVAQVNRNRALSDKVFSIVDKHHQLRLIEEQLAAGLHIVFVCTKLSHAEAVEKRMKGLFPEKKIQGFNSKNRPASGTNVKTAWQGLDLLIYTSTYTVGASFEDKWYSVLHGHFSNCSASAMEAMQMLGRVRDIESKVYFLSFTSAELNAVPSMEAIEREIALKYKYKTDTLETVGKELSKFDSRAIVLDLAGNISLSVDPSTGYVVPTIEKDLFYKVYLANLRAHYLSRRQFIYVIVGMILEYGGNIEIDASLKNSPSLQLTQYDESKQAISIDLGARNTVIEFTDARAIADAPEIEAERYELLGHSTMSVFEQHSYDKHRLRRLYGIPPTEIITPEWVMKYSGRKVLSLWTNLLMLNQGPTFGSAIERMQKRAYTDAAKMHPLEIIDSSTRWINIKLAFDLLRDLGFDLYPLSSFEQAAAVQSDTMALKAPTVMKEFFAKHLLVLPIDARMKKSITADLKKTEPWTFPTTMKRVKGVLDAILGMSLKKPVQPRGGYLLSPCDSFPWDGQHYHAISPTALRNSMEGLVMMGQVEAAIQATTTTNQVRRSLLDLKMKQLTAPKAPVVKTMEPPLPLLLLEAGSGPASLPVPLSPSEEVDIADAISALAQATNDILYPPPIKADPIPDDVKRWAPTPNAIREAEEAKQKLTPPPPLAQLQ